MKLVPYPEYKDSGLPWLGRVPEHWSLLPNRALFAEVKDRDHPDEEMLSVTITRGIVQQKVLLENSSKKDSSKLDRSAYKLVQPRDIAYNKMRAWQGAIGASALRGIVSPAYVVMRLRNERDLPSYYHYLYRTPQFAKEAERWSYGITSDMWSLRPEHFRMIYSPEPPPDEQAAIVRFLDWANGRLERAIRVKRKVIALLNEQKQVIIHRAVTRGLDPSVPLKLSGIPWLGDIPQHWEVRKVKYLVAGIGGMTPNKGVSRYWGGNVPWVSPKDMKRRDISDSQDHITDVAVCETNIPVVPCGAVLIVVRGMILARTIPTAVSMVPVTVNQDMKALLPRGELDGNFLASLLTGIQRELLSLVEESGHGTRCLRTDSWENFVIPLPPLPEQEQINEYLKSELATVNDTISRLEREIELLREYRTRLVADVVTGKLDVREAAARLPDEAPLDSIEDDAELDDEMEAADEEAVA
jgi:type I restriction enzyme S subunit